jgi:two-component system, chemotaxis family, response regulator Rcp1
MIGRFSISGMILNMIARKMKRPMIERYRLAEIKFSNPAPDRPGILDILLVEDNPGDARLIIEVLRDGKFLARIHHVVDGEEAMTFLRRQPPYENMPRPEFVLLDLNMPRKNGWEVLKEIRATSELTSLPVIILSTSEAETDIDRAYAHHANCFLNKPIDLDEFVRTIGLLKDFWLTAVRLPKH